MLLSSHTVWQSSNEGYTWSQVAPGEQFLAIYHHSYSNDRAYLVTGSTKFYYTTDTGRSWHVLDAPTPPNSFSAQVIQFHPLSDNLLWVGNVDCDDKPENCHAAAFFSRDNGRTWHEVEQYVRNCAWARDADLKVDSTQILCESYKNKQGNQRLFQNNPLEFVSGTNYFQKKTKLFDHVVGFAKFSEYLVVAEVSFRQSSNPPCYLPGFYSIYQIGNLWISRYRWTDGRSPRASSRPACTLKHMYVFMAHRYRPRPLLTIYVGVHHSRV